MSKIYPHANYVAPRKQLQRALANPTRGRFIWVIGPSGVGKTTLRRSILRSMCGDPRLWGAGNIPVIEKFALLPSKAYFNSLWLAQSLVRELFVPNVNWLRDDDDLENPTFLAVKAAIEQGHQPLQGVSLPKGPEPAMWEHFQRLAPERKVWLAAIDQAHALCTNHRNKDPADHILNLLSILDVTDMNILLSGVHGAADLWAARPEVRRRSTVIWMPPYSHERPGDRDPFLTLLRTLGEGYTFSRPGLLFDMAAELMAASAGIFGVLKKILIDAKERADFAGRRAITKGDVTASYYGNRDFTKMLDDVAFFEEVMRSADISSLAKDVASAWGIKPKSKTKKPADDVGPDKEAA